MEGSSDMMLTRLAPILVPALMAICTVPSLALSQVAILEFVCPTCGYRQQFIQGSRPEDRASNVQHIIVVCERAKQIRNIAIPLDAEKPAEGEALIARQYGQGRSELLGIRLPRFLVPGNTCPLFPISAYLERNICPVHGSEGLRFSVVGQY